MLQLELFPTDEYSPPISQYISLKEFCTCSDTYKKYSSWINPYPKNPESVEAIRGLCDRILDPIISHFGVESFRLTYGFCSPSLKRFLTLEKARISPNIDQHIAHERNLKGSYYCSRLGAACDFQIIGENSSDIIRWIAGSSLPFDRIYFYGDSRPIHISWSEKPHGYIWGFTEYGTPRRLSF